MDMTKICAWLVKEQTHCYFHHVGCQKPTSLKPAPVCLAAALATGRQSCCLPPALWRGCRHGRATNSFWPGCLPSPRTGAAVGRADHGAPLPNRNLPEDGLRPESEASRVLQADQA